MTIRTLWLALAVLTFAGSARAQTELCDGLAADEKKVATELLGRLKPYECCSDTFEKCLASSREKCPIVTRLANSICRSAGLGKDAVAIETFYNKRRTSMQGPTTAFTLDEAFRVGDAAAPIPVVVYACTRCPFCKDVVLGLHTEVTEDRLRGKVRLYLRPFPLKSHEGSTEGALALMAAASLHKLWPMTVYVYRHFSEFHPDVLADWASFSEMDRSAFEKAVADEKTREALAQVKKEGLRNAVEATPTVFINGKRYSGDLEMGALVDAALEAFERKK